MCLVPNEKVVVSN